MPTRRYYANAAPQQTLASSITSGALTCAVAGSFAGWPTQFPYFAALDIGTASFEIVSVTNVVGTTATIVRSQDGTAAIAHPAGATLNQIFVRQDLDEANAHTVATAGVHGISGSVVGTSDNQTLSNKTNVNPTINGANVSGTWAGTMAASGLAVTSPIVNSPTISNPVSTGDATHPALVGKATTAGGKTLSLQNSAGAEKLGVDDAGSLSAVKLAGALVPTPFTNEAAANAALGTVATNTIIWLTAPTGGAPAGPYTWNGTVWAPMRAWSAGDTAQLGASSALATAGTPVATPGSVTFTLPAQSIVRIDAIAQFEMLTGTSGRYYVRPAYNSGASVVLGSATGIGFFATTMPPTTGASAMTTATTFGTVTLAAGQYTAYGLLTRTSGGGATDIAQSSEVIVTVTPV